MHQETISIRPYIIATAVALPEREHRLTEGTSIVRSTLILGAETARADVAVAPNSIIFLRIGLEVRPPDLPV